jgi:dTDP-4-amino-4,6-dideoxygalactose transaminase
MHVPFMDLGPMTSDVRDQVSSGWSALLDSNRFIGGEAVDRFESQWAAYCGTSEAVGVANGTDALQLTLRALGIGPDDEVIVPANTFVATAEAVLLAGATPRFADVDPHTLLITPATAEAAVSPRTRAIVVVHLYGQMPDMDALRVTADRLGVALIEDAAQAHGASWLTDMAGSVGHAGCFSFYPGKNLGAFGDAGAVVTSDAQLAARIRSLRDHGRIAGSHYDHGLVGTNSRLDAVQAVVLSAKLAHLDRWNAARRAIAERYRAAATGRRFEVVAETTGSRGVYHLAVIRTPRRPEVQRWLAAQGIDTAVHYPTPIHCLEPYRRFADEPLPAAESAAPELLSLPMYPHLAPEQLQHVCEALELVDQLLEARGAVRA